MSIELLNEQPIAAGEKDGQYIDSLKYLNVGSGDKTFKTDDNGIFLGADKFEDAPFSVDYLGALISSSGTFGGTLSAVDGTLSTLTIASGGNIKLGQTAYNTGTGFWLGDDSGTPKFSIGNGSTKYLTWDGTSLSIRGTLNADDITAGTLSGRTVKANGGGSGIDVWLNSSSGSLEFIYNGALKSYMYTNSVGNAIVSSDGLFVVSGKGIYITADSGTDSVVSGGRDMLFDLTRDFWITGCDDFAVYYNADNDGSDCYFLSNGSTKMTLSSSGNLWVAGNVSADSFTDRTPFYEGNAIEDIKKIKGKDGNIDHDSLPSFIQKKTPKIKSRADKNKGTEKEVEEVLERDLGACISVLMKAVIELDEKISNNK